MDIIYFLFFVRTRDFAQKGNYLLLLCAHGNKEALNKSYRVLALYSRFVLELSLARVSLDSYLKKTKYIFHFIIILGRFQRIK